MSEIIESKVRELENSSLLQFCIGALSALRVVAAVVVSGGGRGRGRGCNGGGGGNGGGERALRYLEVISNTIVACHSHLCTLCGFG